MGEQPVEQLRPQDRFLRRILFNDHITAAGIIPPKAFKDSDPEGLSWTFKNDTLMTLAAVRDYHAYWCGRIGRNLRGIISISMAGLTEAIDPPFTPRYVWDPEDDKYGHLHYQTRLPVDSAERILLAKVANDSRFGKVEVQCEM